jgi:signal peptidase complex subunit 1
MFVLADAPPPIYPRIYPTIPLYQRGTQMDQLRQIVEATIDFEGQKFAEQLQKQILIIGSVLSFFAGLLTQRIELTVYGVASTVVVALLLVTFPLPVYNKNPLNWQLPSH